MRTFRDANPARRSRAHGKPMIEFEVTCISCTKAITLRVRDEPARAFFETHGALCEACYKPGYQPASARRAA
jgi:hypothetical protein